MSEKSNLAVHQSNGSGIQVTSMDDMWRMARAFSGSGLVPQAFNTPEKCFIALQYCLEQNLKPFSSMKHLMVVNGTIAEWGDLVKARVLGSGLCRNLDCQIVGEGDDAEAQVSSLRDGWDEPRTTTFSVQDARTAGLWGKRGPWAQHPKRMLEWKAFHRHFSNFYADALKGVVMAEEAMDYTENAVPEEPPVGRLSGSTFGFDEPRDPDPDADPDAQDMQDKIDAEEAGESTLFNAPGQTTLSDVDRNKRRIALLAACGGKEDAAIQVARNHDCETIDELIDTDQAYQAAMQELGATRSTQ